MYRVEDRDWRTYWGQSPAPRNMEPLGVIWVGDGTRIENGALFQNDEGRFWVGNAGVLKALPTREVAKALSEAPSKFEG
ncbi:MAG: hypothetical protein JW704_11305 [Anaerolineaceae bacterium]|nr:hypothetical protein [Anaerolineaceae bacterium]